MNNGVYSDIINFLKADIRGNINVINFIENYTPVFLIKSEDSVILKGRSDREWVYIVTKSKSRLKEMLKYLDDGDKNFAVIEDWMIPVISEGKKIKWLLKTNRLILNSNMFDNNPLLDNLKESEAMYVFENSDYKEYLTPGYVRDRITSGVSSVIRLGGKPAAWGMTHDDGAIGFLNVLPQFRGRGLGKNVSIDMIQKVIKSGKLPFVHIEEGNTKSMNLAQGLGFVKDKTINWMQIE